MDRKKSPNRTKRQHKVVEDNYWDCSVCTYRNTAEAFKCLMCDTRKGTSTRKPRLNPQLAAAQQAVQPQYTGLAVSGTGTGGTTTGASIKREKSTKRRSSQEKDPSKRLRKGPPRLSNVDRSSAQTREITVNNVTVVITEYELKKRRNDTVSSAASSETDTDTPRGRDSNATDSPSS